MPDKRPTESNRGSKQSFLLSIFYFLPRTLTRHWRRGWWQKALIVIVTLITFFAAGSYAMALWYQHGQKGQPVALGVSFIPDYASYLGVNPQKTMDALIGIGVRNFRLVSYWNDIEPTEGHYDFSQLDWQFQKAEAAQAHIILTIGLRQPRWPECHEPRWVNISQPSTNWQPQLEQYMSAVINRYKHSPALQSYQLENEYFLKGFGTCTDMSRGRLVSEYNLVKQLDPHHAVIIGRSNNGLGTPLGQPTPDEFSISIYQRVWDATVTHRYIQYPFPSWWYATLAGVQKLTTGKNMMIAELQAEPWPPHGKNIPDVSLAEQNKSFNAARLKNTIKFAEQTGMKDINLWGAEYWYYRMQVLHDPSVWNAAHGIFEANTLNK
jgi:hypothetical protein